MPIPRRSASTVAATAGVLLLLLVGSALAPSSSASPSRGKAVPAADPRCEAKVVTIYAPIEDIEAEQNAEMMGILDRSDREEAAKEAAKAARAGTPGRIAR